MGLFEIVLNLRWWREVGFGDDGVIVNKLGYLKGWVSLGVI